jgi:predicted flap endonuclease-1-like 5' DNA nuclease
MSNQFQIDLKKYTLQRFKKSLQSRDLIPSRVVLKDNLETRFQILADTGITNLQELIDALKNKAKLNALAEKTGLPVDYLTLLNREAKSYLTKPVRLDKFPDVSTKNIARLEKVGVKNSKHIFDASRDNDSVVALAEKADIPLDALNELIALADLSRIYGVGPVFARIIYDVGIHSVTEFVQHTGADLVRIYEEQTGKKADFGAGEIEFSLELAKELVSG